MIAVAFALEFESAAFRSKLPIPGVEVWVLGAMGAAAAESLRRKLEKQKPDLVISAGFAGALQPGIPIGAMIAGDNYTSIRLSEIPQGWRRGDILTAQAIIEKAAEKKRLGESTGALAGDLESSLIAEVCAQSQVPMLAIRCISDMSEEDMPVPADALLNPKTNRHDSLALFRHLITRPESITGFARLLKSARQAQKSLAAGLIEILPNLMEYRGV